MPDVQQEILAWLHAQQDWLQDAAEILLSAGSVSDAEVDRLAALLKTPAGQQVTTHRSFDGVASAPASADELRLLGIGDIRGIENLAPRSPLAFGAKNLCVIYGQNASGKSGYVRLLKKICGKPRATELRPNVFQAAPAKRGCTVGYALGGAERPVEWSANDPPIDDLRAVVVFDADASVSYLTEETAVSYTPPSVALFEALAEVCKRVKARLQAEQAALASALPVLPSAYVGTDAGTAYGSLRPDLDEAAVQRLVQWQADDEQALEQLAERLKAADPAASARGRRSTQGQVGQLVTLLKAAADAFSPKRLADIRVLRLDAAAKRRIAIESAKMASAELDGVGTDTWRALWEAARAYSQVAYPGKSYPVIEDARCVLCQQALEPEAQARLRDFEDFVIGQLETDAEAAETAYQQALDELPVGLDSGEIATRCQAAGLTDPGWPTQLVAFWDQARKTRNALLEDEIEEPAAAVTSPTAMLTALTQYAEGLGREAAQLDQDAKQFDRAQAGKDTLNLEARRWIAQQAPAIRAEITRLRSVAAYEIWKGAANSREISIRAGEIARQVVTQAFVDRFNAELNALGASRIKVELYGTRTERGRSLHKLRLKGAQTGQNLPGSVLSDGERRIVGLAAFLADVAGQPRVAPFVFDDPISSLDNDYEWYVAVRLAQLAATRQVIVFTHRLSLYGAMEDAAKKLGDKWKDRHLDQQCIESFAGTSGHPVDQAVWTANTATANEILLKRLGDARRAGEVSGAEAYRNLAQGICSDFRKLVERTVEDDLLNKVVKRHRRSVTTDNRLSLLQCIAKADCRFIDDLMTKYSPFEHSQSREAPVFIPDEPELRRDIESLQKWRIEFRSRRTGDAADA